MAKSTIRTHQGHALQYVANAYPLLIDVILEVVQNALDSGASRVTIAVDQRKRSVDVLDNGSGATVEKFNLALDSVCQTLKKEDKLGQFGIGLISPLGKCESFTFMSCPKENHGTGYTQWTFVTEDIVAQDIEVKIPQASMAGYIFSAHETKTVKSEKGVRRYVPWRTWVHIEKYTKDTRVSRIRDVDELIEEILEKFSVAMRMNNVRLNLNFTDQNGIQTTRTDVAARPFTGTPLEVFRARSGTSGWVTVQLYMARSGVKGPAGKVTFGQQSNPFRFGWRLFILNAREFLEQETIECLSSGVFEGEILSEYAKLTESRKSFVKNDILADMCKVLNEWYLKVGVHHMVNAKDENAGKRYQELGLKSLQTIETMLKDPRFSGLTAVMESFRRGTVGDGHTPPKKGQSVGEQGVKSLSSQAVIGRPPNGGGGGGGGGDTPSDPLPKHHPFTVTGPRGTRRTLVKNDSLGLQFSHTPMEGSSRLWELDALNGILHFNIRHPLWVQCDTQDAAGARKVCQLQEFIAIQALTLHSAPPDSLPIMGRTFDEMSEAFAFLIENSTAFMRKNKA